MIKKNLILLICLIVNFLSAQTDSLVGDDHAEDRERELRHQRVVVVHRGAHLAVDQVDHARLVRHDHHLADERRARRASSDGGGGDQSSCDLLRKRSRMISATVKASSAERPGSSTANSSPQSC